MSLSKKQREYYGGRSVEATHVILRVWLNNCLGDLDDKDKEIEKLKAILLETAVNLEKVLSAYRD